MQSGRNAVTSLYSDQLATLRSALTLDIGLQDAESEALQLLTATDPTVRSRVATDLAARLSPQVSSGILAVEHSSSGNRPEERNAATTAAQWVKFQQLLANGALRAHPA